MINQWINENEWMNRLTENELGIYCKPGLADNSAKNYPVTHKQPLH